MRRLSFVSCARSMITLMLSSHPGRAWILQTINILTVRPCAVCLGVQHRAWTFSPQVSDGQRHREPLSQSRRRARPRWHGYKRDVNQVGWCSSRRGLCSSTKVGEATSGAAQQDRQRDVPVGQNPPLTYAQLPEESMYILDGTSMLFRAFYGRGAGGYLAANGATEVGAVLAMGIEFAQFINEVRPRYIAMAFDVGRETTFRRNIFPAYKAQRKPIPTELALQMPLARALSEALGCRTFAVEGYEADDVMATLARWARSVGLGAVIYSADKDMCQLVRDRVHVMHPRSNGYTVLGDEEVQAKFGVKPRSLPDLFGLVGDAADNIPGVRGVGQKGGSRLLQKFGSLEGLFAGLEHVGSMDIRGSKGLQDLLSRPGIEDEAMLYREIATLHDEVPIEDMGEFGSSFFLYTGASPEAEAVTQTLGFTAPLRMIQEGLTSPSA